MGYNQAVLLALLHRLSSFPSFPVAFLDLLGITAAGQHRNQTCFSIKHCCT